MALQSCPRSVLITRPLAQALRFAAQLADAGIQAVPLISPLLAPVLLRPDLPDIRFGAIVLSSETGAQAAASLRDSGVNLPDTAFCVGDQTARVARALGFMAHSAAGDVHDLLALILRHRDRAPFVHLRGRETTGDLVTDMQAAGIDARFVIVYAQEPQPLTQAALDVLAMSEPVLVPLFSPRSARLFCVALSGRDIHAPLSVVAISTAAALELPEGLAQTITIASQPDAPAMLRAIGDLCVKP